MHSKHLVLGLAVVGTALLSATQAAKAVSLTTLLGASPGNVIVVGNTVYSNFSYGGTTPSANVIVNSSATGLSFTTTTGGWSTPSGSSVLGYDVTLTGGTFQSVGLGFTASASGGAAAFVGETITDLANNKDYSLQVYTDGAGGRPDNATASVILNPATSRLHVIKSIDVAAAGTGSTASITLVDNTYVQGGGGDLPPTPGVPEPMSLALLPLGLAALAARRRKLSV